MLHRVESKCSTREARRLEKHQSWISDSETCLSTQDGSKSEFLSEVTSSEGRVRDLHRTTCDWQVIRSRPCPRHCRENSFAENFQDQRDESESWLRKRSIPLPPNDISDQSRQHPSEIKSQDTSQGDIQEASNSTLTSFLKPVPPAPALKPPPFLKCTHGPHHYYPGKFIPTLRPKPGDRRARPLGINRRYFTSSRLRPKGYGPHVGLRLRRLRQGWSIRGR